MNQETANYIMQRMSKYLDNSQMIKLKDTLDESLRQSEDGFLEKSSQELLDMFIATKRLEGRSFLLIPVMHLLCKAHEIFHFNQAAVIQDRRTAHPSEHLMLVGHNHFEIKICTAVKHRYKIHLKPPV